MFGYIMHSKLDLTFRDFRDYKGYYCGVCKTIKDEFSEKSRMTLSYDITFMAIVLSAVYEKDYKFDYKRCFANWFQKKRIIQNKYIKYCTYISSLFVYYKILDDCYDDKTLIASIKSKLFYKDYIKAKEKYPKIDLFLREKFDNIKLMEKDKKTSFEEVLDSFGNILGEVFVINSSDENATILRKVGCNLGKYIYILDAIDDYEDDKKNNNFNLLNCQNNIGGIKNIKEYTVNIIKNIQNSLTSIKLNHSKSLISNIVNLGLYRRLNSIIKNKGDFLK